MNINWYGQTCFRINTQRNRDGFVNILIDPLSKEFGLRVPKMEADILFLTDDSQDKRKDISSAIIQKQCFLIDGPGEYDIKDVYIKGISAKTKEKGKDTTIYTIESEGIKICHLGTLGQEELTAEQVEEIGIIDILMLPIGGGPSLDAKQAIKIMSQTEPNIIIPMYYQIPKLKTKLETLDSFLKILGIKKPQALAKLSVKKKDIPKEEAKIVVLEP